MGWWTLAHTHMHIEKISHQKNVALGQNVTEWENSNIKKHLGKMSQHGKEKARNRLEICHRWTKCHNPGKRGWTWCHKWHDVHLVTWVDEKKSRDVVNGCQIVTGMKCHSGLNIQWTFRWVEMFSGHSVGRRSVQAPQLAMKFHCYISFWMNFFSQKSDQ